MFEIRKLYSEYKCKITWELKLQIYHKIICLNIFFRLHYLFRTKLPRNVSKKISLLEIMRVQNRRNTKKK